MLGRFGTIILGVWLVIAPFVLQYNVASARANDFWTGLAVIAIALVAMFTGGGVRFINTGLGAWLVASPFILNYLGHQTPVLNDMLVGIGVIAFSLIHSIPRRHEFHIARKGEVLPH